MAAMELCHQRGWTDGLPVVPPTPERVEAMLAGGGVEAQAVLGRIPERRRTIRAEQVAINAVMAGCLPAYMPVVLAAVRALLEPAFGLHGPTASTAGVGILTIVHGPVARAIGMNCGEDVFGPRSRANATIGRAIRLLLLNAAGHRFDRATLGHPGRFTYCIAEQEEAGWEPLHVLRGLPAASSAVTVMAAEAPNQVSDHVSTTGEGILNTIAARMAAPGSMNAEAGKAQMAVVICPEHRRTLQAEGWSKAGVAEYLWEHARTAAGRPVVPTAADLLLLTAGGEAGRFSAVICGWATRHQSAAVTMPIGREG